MNSYEEKIERRRERYSRLARQAQEACSMAERHAREMASIIPMGQPILVGHHSEKRDRNYRARIDRKFLQAVRLQEKARYYEQKAANAGRCGISSDDPEAVTKLKEKIATAKAEQARMVAVNKLVRAQDLTGLKAMFPDAPVEKFFAPDFAGRIGFPDYKLRNNSANIRRMEKRCAALMVIDERETSEVEGAGYTYREDTKENRVMFLFPGKPEELKRKMLKSYGFKWSPTRSAWVRQLNNSGIYAARQVREQLEGKKNEA